MANVTGFVEPPGLIRLKHLIEQPKAAFSESKSLHSQVQSTTGLGGFWIQTAVDFARRKWRAALRSKIEALQQKQEVLQGEIEALGVKLRQDPIIEEDLKGVICQLVLQRWEIEAQVKEMADEEPVG